MRPRAYIHGIYCNFVKQLNIFNKQVFSSTAEYELVNYKIVVCVVFKQYIIWPHNSPVPYRRFLKNNTKGSSPLL